MAKLRLLDEVAADLNSLIYKVVLIIFEGDPARFIKTHYIPVDGTEQSLIAFSFDSDAFGILFETEFSAALRARASSFEIPRRDDLIAGHVSHS